MLILKIGFWVSRAENNIKYLLVSGFGLKPRTFSTTRVKVLLANIYAKDI